MSDFENQVAEALDSGAAAAPSAIGLADAARARARTRRRTRAGAAAVAVALAVAVPLGVVALDGSGGGRGGDGAGPATGASVAIDPQQPGDLATGGHHWESWHTVQVEVPNTWAYGALATWCLTEGITVPSEAEPVVERPGVVESIGCTPTNGYGVSFAAATGDSVDLPVAGQTTGTAYSVGTFVGARVIGDVVVTVSTRTSEEAELMLGSARTIGSFDVNSCAPALEGSIPAPEAGSMAVCRYDESGRLEQSELLTGDQAASALRALRTAPTGSLARCTTAEPYKITMTSQGVRAVVEFGGGCPHVAVDRTPHLVTKDVMLWALSPGWSGTVPRGTPLPDELRER